MASRFLKLVVLTADLLLLVIGVIQAALGVWVVAVDYGLVKFSKVTDDGLYTSTLVEPGLLEVAAYLCIAVGVVKVVTCGIALHGWRKESKCFLATSVALFLALILVDVIIIILTGLTHRRTDEQLHGALVQGLTLQYDSLVQSQFAFSVYFDRAQVQLECCGVDNYTDIRSYAKMWGEKVEFQIPRTCCVMPDKGAYLDNDQYLLATPTCHRTLTNYHQTPCLGPITDWLNEKSFVLLAFSAFVAFVMLICSLLNVMLLRGSKEDVPFNDL